MIDNKPAFPTRNLVMFLITSMFIMVTWTWYQNRNQPQRLTAQQQREVREAVAPLGLAPSGGPFDPWNFLAAEITRRIPSDDRLKAYDEAVAAKQKEDESGPKPAIVPKFEPQYIPLGDATYNLQVRLTTRGGGVDRVIVTNFPQADRYGKPVRYPDGSPRPLNLIPSPDDLPEEERAALSADELRPAFLLYHYAHPDDQRPEPILGEAEWKVVAPPADVTTGRQEVALAAELPEFGIRATKTFTLEKDAFHIGLAVKIEPLPGASPKPLRYQLSGGRNLPIEGEWYTGVFRQFITGWTENESARRHLETSAEIHTNRGSERLLRAGDGFQYAAVTNQYFAVATCVDETQENKKFIEYVRATAEGTHPKERPTLGDITPRMISESLNLAGAPIEHRYLLYHGPVKVRQLYQLPDRHISDELVERYAQTLNLRTMTDFSSPTALGRFASFIGWSDLTIAITNLMHWLLGNLMSLLRIPVLAIVALTVIVRLCLMPLSRRQTASMQRLQEKMAALQPKIKALEEKYKGNTQSQEFQQEKLRLMLDNGVNPAAQLGGCLLMFLQLPVFMGLYYALQENVYFRLQPFLWVENLAAPDMLFWWGENIPVISVPPAANSFFSILYLGPYFNILPIIVMVLMLVQQKLMTPPPADAQQAQQQKLMKYMMLAFGLFFFRQSSGLVLYFICSTTWGLIERKLFPKVKATTDKPGDGGPHARLKDKPEPPKQSWLMTKFQQLQEAAEKKHNTERRSGAPPRPKPRKKSR